jgi:hypothetical protein
VSAKKLADLLSIELDLLLDLKLLGEMMIVAVFVLSHV